MVNDVEQDVVSGRGCELTFCSDPNPDCCVYCLE